MATQTMTHDSAQNQTARGINMVLGIWLFISAFLWLHSPAQMTNTWILGVLCFIFAFASLRQPSARFLNTILSIWLFISAFVLPSPDSRTVWNNAIVAIAVFILSMVPGEESGLRRPTPPQPV